MLLSRFLRVVGIGILLPVFLLTMVYLYKTSVKEINFPITKASSRNNENYVYSWMFPKGFLIIKAEDKSINLKGMIFHNATINFKTDKLIINGTAKIGIVESNKIVFKDFNGNLCNGTLHLKAKELKISKGKLSVKNYLLKGKHFYFFGKREKYLSSQICTLVKQPSKLAIRKILQLQ